MYAPNDLELLPPPHPLPFKNDKHSILKVKFKIKPMKCVGKYGRKHDFKTFAFKTKCVDVHEGHSTCLYSFSHSFVQRCIIT